MLKIPDALDRREGHKWYHCRRCGVPFDRIEIQFRAGTTEPAVGSTITGNDSGATAIVDYVKLLAGSWDEGTAEGLIWCNLPSVVDPDTGHWGTEDEDITITTTPTERMSTGGFDPDTDWRTDWHGMNCSLDSVSGGVSGNCLQVTRIGGNTQAAYQIVLALTRYQEYTFSAYVKSGTAGNTSGKLFIESSMGDESYTTNFTSSTSWVQHSLVFTPIAFTQYHFYLWKDNPTPGTILFDTVSLS